MRLLHVVKARLKTKPKQLHKSDAYLIWAIFLFNYFNVRLLDYSILLKARHDESIYESITLHNHKLILSRRQSWDYNSKMKEKIISPPQGFEPWSPWTESQCTTNELCWPPPDFVQVQGRYAGFLLKVSTNFSTIFVRECKTITQQST